MKINAEKLLKQKNNEWLRQDLCNVISLLADRLSSVLQELEECRKNTPNSHFATTLGERIATLEAENSSLKDENERLAKELKEYEILVSCSDLDNFNPAHFQQGEHINEN
ncbi:hypothetical protein DMB95_09235 [Campylobacter sp. MIT 12-8780]|uniref:hypothetical protein n=1 Tax=unclassified Campylobacter TaxID=2593542 RepID=UPI0010F4973A|nr:MULTISPECIES: hypothetical protein [unclassified Campylobacter]NDJ28070.1 hypothetical protein [Campylobacter sp. MIT 19-121]TKX28252.1 hypothetical protein CQA38_08360 [Campylobacter sp. MIT 12-5580]TQR39964.1 hypothetical protein DMB95_09235 [Campylobacter sp. MIT 12-8780]